MLAPLVELKYLLVEEFADLLEVPVDYVWAEIADPRTMSEEEIVRILTQLS